MSVTELLRAYPSPSLLRCSPDREVWARIKAETLRSYYWQLTLSLLSQTFTLPMSLCGWIPVNCHWDLETAKQGTTCDGVESFQAPIQTHCALCFKSQYDILYKG